MSVRKENYSRFRDDIKKRWDLVAKPLDSLGEFENITAKIGAIQGTVIPKIDKRAIIVMCADNGVVDEGISQSGREVTLAVAKSMGKGKSSVCKMADVCGADVIPIDVGIDCDEAIEGVINKKIRRGTRNFAITPAMEMEEMYKAIRVGIDIVGDCKKKGYTILGTGEMGIGNTTTSTCVAAALLQIKAKEIVGRGAGLSDEGLMKKEKIIDETIMKYNLYEADPINVLAHAGGFDIAALVGVIIGGAIHRIPIVLDGIITAVAALVAVRILPQTANYIIPSHLGKEPSMRKIYEEIGLNGIIHANLALGEGTGAVMMFPLLDMIMNVYKDQTTFDEIEVEQYRRF
ncbi:MAG: nicotinate-nucleotide--dimethylbenzimidazole phosphoribosyltransferase [Lachnospiraceae bacterium]|nr:nicotinate-nucleotide--dimethylbenzimidazole phosphoribosyltransferase [Lachnospiraceae bacterium]